MPPKTRSEPSKPARRTPPSPDGALRAGPLDTQAPIEGRAAEAPPSEAAAATKASNRGDKPARERLVDAARELFHQHGYEATGVAQILERAGVGSGSLYHFFSSKEDLLCAVLDWYQAHLWPVVMWPVFTKVCDPIDRVFAVLNFYREAIVASQFTFGCPIGNLALELATCRSATREKIAKNFDGWKDAIRQCLELGKDRFVSDVDLDGLAAFILTVMEGGIMQARSHNAIEPFDAAVAQLRDYFNRLVRNNIAEKPAKERGKLSQKGRK